MLRLCLIFPKNIREKNREKQWREINKAIVFFINQI